MLEGYLWHAEEVEAKEHLEGEAVPDDFGIAELERQLGEKPRRRDPVESDSVTLVEEAENRCAPDGQHPTGEAGEGLWKMRKPEPEQPFSPT